MPQPPLALRDSSKAFRGVDTPLLRSAVPRKQPFYSSMILALLSLGAPPPPPPSLTTPLPLDQEATSDE